MIFIRQRARVMALLAMVAFTFAGCSTVRGWFGGDNGFSERKAEYDAAYALYKTDVGGRVVAQEVMEKRRTAGDVLDRRWDVYKLSEIGSAMVQVQLDAALAEWERTQKKPLTYDGLAQLYKEHVANMIAAAKEPK